MEAQELQSDTLLVPPNEASELKREALGLPSLSLNKRQLCDLELILNKAFAPLTGFLSRSDYESVLDSMRLANGALWPMPVCLDMGEGLAKKLKPGDRLSLLDGEGFMLAVLQVEDLWRPDKENEALKVYGTSDTAAHPGVRAFMENFGEYYVSGVLRGVALPPHFDFLGLRLTPAQVRRRLERKGWLRVAAFQTTDYLHRAQVEAVRWAATQAETHLLIQPAVGLRYPGQVEHYTQVRCYQKIMGHLPDNLALLAILPLALRQAGPREALLQALVRKNFGCTHFLTARDEGDPFTQNGNGHEPFYTPGGAEKLLAGHAAESGVEPLPLPEMSYVEDRAMYLPRDQVPQGSVTKSITSRELRRRLEFGLEVPAWFSYPEVLEELVKTYPPRHRQGFTVFFTGLSGSGKSTLAKVLLTKFMAMRDRPVTLLDGDIVRKNLSSELGFSKEHRMLNVQRIGYVASEITKNRGIALCAPISPYEAVRRKNRELISRYGGYIEVYLNTPLEKCEERDRKGLYAKARAGIIKGVTGIDDPYEIPEQADLTLDTSQLTPEECAQEVLLHIAKLGYIR